MTILVITGSPVNLTPSPGMQAESIDYEYVTDFFWGSRGYWHDPCYVWRPKEDTSMRNESGISMVEALTAVATLSMIVAIVVPSL